MNTRYINPVLLLVLSLVSTACLAAKPLPLTLARNGATPYVIVVSASADPSDKAVANDLASILRQMTRATFRVVDDKTAPVSTEIVIGENNSRLKILKLDKLTKGFGYGEYVIRTVGQRLLIAGSPPRGTINGVYGFLQDHLACRWFTPGCQDIPEMQTVTIAPFTDRRKPAFRWRSTMNPQGYDANFTVRNRLNMSKAEGGSVATMMLMSDPRTESLGNYYPAHTMGYIPESVGKEHPEWLALVAGERRFYPEPQANMRAYCVTNPEFVKYMAGFLTPGVASSDPKRITFAGLGQSDSSNHCQCDVCKANYSRVGISGTYMEFVNNVAAEIAKTHPNAIIDTLAYGMTFSPTSVKMRDNVLVTWCPISACYMHGLGDCAPNREGTLLQQCAQWRQNAKLMQVWYYFYQSDCWNPHPRLFAAQSSFKEFRKQGLDGVFVEPIGAWCGRRKNPVSDGDKLMPAYNDSAEYGWFTVPVGMTHLKTYLSCRLMWDPDYDLTKGIKEFCTAYYGAAGPELAQWAMTEELESSYDRTNGPTFASYRGVHMDIGGAPYMKIDVLEKADALFEKAEKKVAKDKTLLRRVRMARLSPDLAVLCTAPLDHPLRARAFARFFPLVEELGVPTLRRTSISGDEMTIADFKALAQDKTRLENQISPPAETLGANLLTNPDFEETAQNGLPPGWTTEGKYFPEDYDLDKLGVAVDRSTAHAGRASVRLHKTPKARKVVSVRQRFHVKPGETYQADLYYQTDIETGGLYTIFTAYDKAGNFITHLGGAKGINDTGGDWRILRSQATVDTDTAFLAIEALIYDDQANGTAWIDDFTCRQVLK